MRRADHVTLGTPDGPMTAYRSRPEGEPRGSVVVVHEAFGLTSYIERVADDLAAAGWYAVAPALFHRTGADALPYDFSQARPHMDALTSGGIAADLDATLEHVAEAGFAPASTGMVGFCLGGTATFYADAQRPLGAGVTFYGGGVGAGRWGLPPQASLAPGLHGAWLGLYGDRDGSIPVEEVEALRAAAATAPVPTDVVRYADAGHGFHCHERPDVYRPQAAADAWARTLAWFDEHLPA